MHRTAAKHVATVRFGSKADISVVLIDVRFTPKSGHRITSFYRNPGLILNFRKCGHQSENRNEHRCKT
jgi:hypothetical protein